ncbi:head closure Hc2 [Rhizobium phage AF3]|uniref:Head completion, neck hetero-dimeric protein n=1 Tax=Rhizobium phage AF3 TaxID=2763529 RepID=A0A7G7WW13_9CAUD|nr:head closure Hc2 [Rhizobium phage AF3]QNH71407.1 head completion, neck hetero-dimeric protein [Rhizobium phage AF3]
MTNPYVNNQFYDNEAELIYSLSDELIFNAGIDIEYLPREVVRMDPVLNEPLSSQFNKVYQLDAYIETTDSFSAGNEIFGPVGLSFNFAAASLSVSRRQFIAITGMREPLEGDLIFIKPNQMLFEITNTNVKDPLISGGRHFTYTIYIQPFKYGEGNTSFENKFQLSTDLQSVLGEFLGHVDQTTWVGFDASIDTVYADSMDISADDNFSGISPIIRADTDEFTADMTLTADDLLGIWNESADDVLEMMDDKINRFAQNDKFECSTSQIFNDTNPFGFQ